MCIINLILKVSCTAVPVFVCANDALQFLCIQPLTIALCSLALYVRAGGRIGSYGVGKNGD